MIKRMSVGLAAPLLAGWATHWPLLHMPLPHGPSRPPQFIAVPLQPPPAHNGKAYWFKVSAKQDGSFSVTNQRNGFSKTYAAR